MAASDDSRPFTVLKQSAEDFKASFSEDITQCLAALDSKITELLCDQESTTASYGDAKRLNAYMEFSKAKLGIFVSMKSLIDEMETTWVDQLSELKKAFVENIEIFLAGMKLEVKDDSFSNSGTRKSLSSVKGRTSYQNSPSSILSSIYPTIKNVTDQVTHFAPEDVKPIRKVTAPFALKDTPGLNGSRRNCVRFVEDDIETLMIEDEEEENNEKETVECSVLVHTPVPKRGRGRKSAVNTPASLKKTPVTTVVQIEASENSIAVTPCRRRNVANSEKDSTENSSNDDNPDSQAIVAQPVVKTRRGAKAQLPVEIVIDTVETPVRRGRGSRKSVLNTPASSKKTQNLTPLRRRNAVVDIEKESTDSSDDKPDSQVATNPEIKTRQGAKTLPNESAVVLTPGRQRKTATRRGRKAAANQGVPEPEMETSESDNNKMPSPAGPKTPKNVHFSLGLDINDDLDIYSPEIDLTRSAPRRKTTTVNAVLNTFPDFSLTPQAVRNKSKRKTIAGDFSELPVAPSPKRLKKSGSRNSIAPSTLAMEANETGNFDLLDSDEASGKDNYTPWIPLSDVGAKVPTQPGVYELKVAQAKKPAYIGSCESLRQKLTLHKLKHTSGHKHLDKFIERNPAVMVRFENMSSIADAKLEEKNRIKMFVTQYNTTPAYN